MTVQARIIDNQSLIFLRFTGAQTTASVEKDIQELRSLFGFRPDIPELVDLSDITEDYIDYNGMRRLARIVNDQTRDSAFKKRIALYAPHESTFGSARMFSTLTELEAGNTVSQAFHTPEEALAWLGRSETRFEDLPDYNLIAAE
ncbi:hypothetical protein LX82_02421 [Celeribacter halophilus]|uniref:SpoIIAA-like n=1 Tax=Celeribacter halophilus TaxID=576117 RepID=A0A1I3UJH3_9RHOB|nr:hypothetical protein LX82_02421 [Celeribacter halophilus]SFJ82863.1 hypothetical protein SAMN04488138_111117 [Celeribacter halophilus]